MSLSAVLVLSVQTAATTVVLTVEIVVPTGETAVQSAAMTAESVLTETKGANAVSTVVLTATTAVPAATSARATRPRPLRQMTSKSLLKKSSRFFQFPRQSPE